MNKEDRKQFDELKQYLEKSFKDKYEPGNGWKTARAVFETKTVGALDSICKDMQGLKTSTDKIPDLVISINDIQNWRKKVNKVLIWIGRSIIIPIIMCVIYLFIKRC